MGSVHIRIRHYNDLVVSGLGNIEILAGSPTGHINIDPTFLVLDQSRIQANAFEGNGGNISITAGFLLVTPDSVIEASSQRGIDGIINVDAPDSDVAGSLTALNANFQDPRRLLRARYCCPCSPD